MAHRVVVDGKDAVKQWPPLPDAAPLVDNGDGRVLILLRLPPNDFAKTQTTAQSLRRVQPRIGSVFTESSMIDFMPSRLKASRGINRGESSICTARPSTLGNLVRRASAWIGRDRRGFAAPKLGSLDLLR